MKPKSKSNMILVEAVNEELTSILGSAATSVIFFLERKGSIRSGSNIENLEAFAEGLESIFGFGARVIEKKILEVLYIKLQLPGPKETKNDFEFAKEIEKAIEFYEAKRMKKRGDATQQKVGHSDRIFTCAT